MKKICLLIIIVCCVSCYQDHYDDNYYDYDYDYDYYQRPQYIAPPIWIRGIWMDDKQRGFKFTDDDLLYIYPMQNFISADDEIYNLAIKNWYNPNQYQNPEVQEVELLDYYSLKYNCNNAPSKKFIFTRISKNQIESTGFMPGVYTRQ
ncbi:hypothetical protein SOM12_00145 [Flavobacterium sp. CFBP9031]|uniref:hypothetical protein n=1 Tax=Flavobacterium sp. CFBP9031 TaxID=3096538 RepID=UPI002A6AEA9C|nr:hypothetical protein [Flavobacterium sp. CFBP9031]MDY0985812.1 hypothetical protein [Flavobacterium sp. CFBP9031]